MPEQDELKCIVECLLFVTNEPVSEKRLAEIAGCEPWQVNKLLNELGEDYAGRGFAPRQLAGGWQFTTREECAPYIEKLYKPKLQQLSRAAMETLAIIAYKQPITRAEVAAIRQVDVDGIVSNLLEKCLIQEVGRRLGPGRAVLYGTTDEFLAFFGLNSLEELPSTGEVIPAQDDEGQLALFPLPGPPALELLTPLAAEE